MLLPHLNELSTIVNSNEAIVTMHYGHRIVPFLAFWNFPFPICEEWFTQRLRTHTPAVSVATRFSKLQRLSGACQIMLCTAICYCQNLCKRPSWPEAESSNQSISVHLYNIRPLFQQLVVDCCR